MCENAEALRTKEKEKKIKREIAALKKFYKNCDKEAVNFAKSIIENAAFMIVTLGDLREEINRDGCTTEYKNGENQYGTKKSPAVETYNAMQKNYLATMKQLAELIPKPEAWEEARKKEADDGFDEFVNER